MSDETAPETTGFWDMTDKVYGGVLSYITTKISTFVTFLFFLFTAGAVFGGLMAVKFGHAWSYFAVIPAALELLAYYSRGFATLLFVLFLAAFVFIL